MKIVAVILAFASCAAQAGPYDDTLSCGSPKRHADGSIARDWRVPYYFQKLYPCPSTGKRTGACPGFSRDHPRPLACGGCDSVSNMQWLDNESKRRKDSYERKIYSATPPYPDTAACVPQIVLVP